METWHVSIGFKTSDPFLEDLAFGVSERLEDFAAVMSISHDLASGLIALNIDADSWTDALEVARDAVADALRAEGVEAAVTSVRVQTDAEFQQELLEPVYPKVVGFAEIAKMAGVSRQRVRQLAEKANFPHPVIRTNQGPLYSVHAVDRWLETRTSGHQHVAQTRTA